jgi:hypothetical protein
MKNKLEHILLSVLLGLSILLGLSFWLNTIFSFNLFCHAHWDEFAKLQASHTPISNGFYVSFAVAIFLFAIGIYVIYRPTMRNVVEQAPKDNIVTTPITTNVQQEKSEKEPVVAQPLPVSRPPRLNLPKNMAQIVAQNNQQKEQPSILKQQDKPSENPYNPIISETFSSAGYVIKQNPTISGFVPNLFAIGANEIVWIGGIDCDVEKIMDAIEKLQSVFQSTLEDIPININAFVLDTLNRYDSENSSVLVFKSIDELKEFISQHPADQITNEEQESFDSYSEYIDTIIQYIKNL